MLLAASCGLIAANVCYAQPLVGPISVSLGLSPATAGLVMTMTQISSGAGCWWRQQLMIGIMPACPAAMAGWPLTMRVGLA